MLRQIFNYFPKSANRWHRYHLRSNVIPANLKGHPCSRSKNQPAYKNLNISPTKDMLKCTCNMFHSGNCEFNAASTVSVNMPCVARLWSCMRYKCGIFPNSLARQPLVWVALNSTAVLLSISELARLKNNVIISKDTRTRTEIATR